MEIGQQQVDRLEPIAGGNKEVRVAGKGPDAAALVGGGLQQAEAGGADGDDAAAGGPRLRDRSRGGRVDDAEFGMASTAARLSRANPKWL